MKLLQTACALALMLSGMSAASADRVKVGLVVTLSGSAAVLGQHTRDGFMLAVKEANGKLGGLEAAISIVDDELKPDAAILKTKALIEREKVDFVVGVLFSNVLQAIHRVVTSNEVFLIGTNAGTSIFAGEGCNPFFFQTAAENNEVPIVVGYHAQTKGFKRVLFLLPNYQAGREVAMGFRQMFQGEVLEEIYVPLGQIDFSSELAKIAGAKPDAVLAFMPGGMGVNFVKQYRQAGLTGKVPLLTYGTVDETTLPAIGSAALGIIAGAFWTPDLKNQANLKFVEAFKTAYGYAPSTFAAQAYDAARLIDAAVKATKGDLKDKNSLRAALRKAEFESVRGEFRFNKNHFPLQNFYLAQAVEGEKNSYRTSLVETVFTARGDNQAKNCSMTQ